MTVGNHEVQETFERLADLLEIEGANPFRVRAYRNAARTVGTLPRSVADLVGNGEDLTELPGIGEDLGGKIEEIVKTGGLRQLQEIEARTPSALAGLLKVSGLGPKRVQTLWQELGVTSLEDLEQAASRGKVRELHGLGEKTEQSILEDLDRVREEEQRMLRFHAEQAVEPLVAYLSAGGKEWSVVVAGSYRRWKETVGDLDVVVVSDDGEAVVDRFIQCDDVKRVASKGETRSTVILRSGLQVDLRVVSARHGGAALLYLTGSKAHGIHLRTIALDRGWKLNEYGVYEDEEQIEGETEEAIYSLFDLPWIPPELREDRGEISAAREGRLPDLIRLEHLRGDLQSHTTASDGRADLKTMALAAKEQGHEYLAITDHSPHVAVTQGLDADALARQMDEIDRLCDELDGFRLLKGIEVDILEDGSLDLDDAVLARLDLTVCSVHSGFDLRRDEQTERIMRAMDNPSFTILGHPTGRRLGKRASYELDMERLLEAAIDRGCYVEINAQPDRLDLNDSDAKMAKDMGLLVAISTDAHDVGELGFLRLGVGQARRAWLEPSDVLNTRPWGELFELLRR